MDFNAGIRNPDEITPPQVIRILPISHELQLARRKYFHRCITPVHAVMWIHLVFKTLTCTVFIARRWNFTHFNICAKLSTKNALEYLEEARPEKKRVIERNRVFFFFLR